MRNLIPLSTRTIPNQGERTVSARKLHQFLGIGRDFSNWIRSRIKQYGFIENQDFIAIRQNRRIGHGKGKTEYFLTLDTAKELAMVERNEKGRQARQYFIECERKLRERETQQTALMLLPTRMLVTVENGQIIDSVTVPDDAIVISRKDLSDINRAFFGLKAALGSAEQAWENISRNPDAEYMGLPG